MLALTFISRLILQPGGFALALVAQLFLSFSAPAVMSPSLAPTNFAHEAETSENKTEAESKDSNSRAGASEGRLSKSSSNRLSAPRASLPHQAERKHAFLSALQRPLSPRWLVVTASGFSPSTPDTFRSLPLII